MYCFLCNRPFPAKEKELTVITIQIYHWISSLCVFTTGISTTVSPIGQCPEISDSPGGSCFTYNHTCLSDEQCSSGFLCCFDGCRLTCLPSVGGITSNYYCCHYCCSCYGCIWILGQHEYEKNSHLINVYTPSVIHSYCPVRARFIISLLEQEMACF